MLLDPEEEGMPFGQGSNAWESGKTERGRDLRIHGHALLGWCRTLQVCVRWSRESRCVAEQQGVSGKEETDVQRTFS